MKKKRIILGLIINISVSAFYLWAVVFAFMQSGIIGLSVLSGLYALNMFSMFYIFVTSKRSDNLIRGAWLWIMIVPGWGFHSHTVFGLVGIWQRRRHKNSDVLENGIFSDMEDITSGNKVEPIFNGDKKYPIIIDEIKKAKKTIYMHYFIISGGIIWEKIKKEILIKADEGVEVIIGTDWVGNMATFEKNYKELRKHPSIKFSHFNPTYPPFSTGRTGQRNHNKILIIDNKVGFFGGINIGDEYAHLYPKYGFWNDIQYRVEGPIVDQLTRRFIVDWFITSGEKLVVPEKENRAPRGNITAKYLYDHPWKEEKVWMNEFIKQIKSAKKSIKIKTPYLVPPYLITEEIEKAVERGVEVIVIVSGTADKKTAYAGTKLYSEKWTSLGVKVMFTDEAFLHSKIYIFDEETVMFGSTNIDYRAIFLHYETNWVTTNREFASELLKQFDYVAERSFLRTKKSTDWGMLRNLYFTVIYKSITVAM